MTAEDAVIFDRDDEPSGRALIASLERTRERGARAVGSCHDGASLQWIVTEASRSSAMLT